MTKEQKVDSVMEMVKEELRRAIEQHSPMLSAHEGFAVILEEVDELKAEVWKRHKDVNAMRKEALQVAAMGARFILDITGKE